MKFIRQMIALSSAGMLLVLTAHRAWAKDDAEVDQKLQFIQDSMTRGARPAKIWNYTWEGIQGVLMVGSLAAVPFLDNSGDKTDLYFGAAGSAIGLGYLVFFPLDVIHDQKQLDREIQNFPAGADREQLLTKAEYLFKRSAENEAFGKGWLSHTGNVLFNVALGLGLGLGFDRWESAGISMGAGILVGEAWILTQPDGLVHDWERYQKGQYSIEPQEAFNWQLAPVIGPGTYAAQLTVHF